MPENAPQDAQEPFCALLSESATPDTPKRPARRVGVRKAKAQIRKFDPNALRWCRGDSPRCREPKPASEFRAPNGTLCKDCYRAGEAERARIKRATPEGKAQKSRHDKAYRAKVKADPERYAEFRKARSLSEKVMFRKNALARKRRNARSRKWREKKAQDKAWLAKNAARARADYQKRREARKEAARRRYREYMPPSKQCSGWAFHAMRKCSALTVHESGRCPVHRGLKRAEAA